MRSAAYHLTVPTNTVDYFHHLTDEDRVRISFSEKRGLIVHFIIQYIAFMQGEWREIMRYDTCHGYAHKHTFYLKGEAYIIDLTEPGDRLNEMFTEYSNDIKQNFRRIKENFLRT